VTRYVLKRLLHMVPIVFGVILLTFVLFNIVGGSPAAVVLGKNATVEALETFDEKHGYNKPLLLGRWTPTRAFADGEVHGAADMTAPGRHALALRLALRPRTRYRWRLAYRLSPDGRAAFVHGAPPDGQPVRTPLRASGRWEHQAVDILTGAQHGRDGFAVDLQAGRLELRQARLRRATRHLFDSQFVHYLGRLARLDLGMSTDRQQPVSEILAEGVIPSLTLTVPIFAGGLVLALVLALVCACYRDRLADRALVVLATVLMSVNYVVWIVAGQYLLAFKLGWFPIWGYESWRYLLLPVLIGMATGLGRDLRFYRTAVLDEMYRDYVRTARAKGLATPAILFRHVLRNALVPVITNVSMAVPFLFTGSLMLESFFGIPGLGGLSLNAIHSADMNVVRAVVLIGALLYVAVNVLTDIGYAWVDPRVRLE
jgi:peptide/nickel transport system permease protein